MFLIFHYLTSQDGIKRSIKALRSLKYAGIIKYLRCIYNIRGIHVLLKEDRQNGGEIEQWELLQGAWGFLLNIKKRQIGQGH